jgi:hypothetical protein
MNSWHTVWRRGLVDGAAASVLSAAALSVRGRAEGAGPYAPINAVSRWIWNDEALAHHAPDLRHTLTGYLIHHGCATFWGVVFEGACAGLLERRQPVLTLGAGLAAGAASCFVDYRLTPRRLRPGYEAHLSRPSLALVYAGLGIGLALGAMLCRHDPE